MGYLITLGCGAGADACDLPAEALGIVGRCVAQQYRRRSALDHAHDFVGTLEASRSFFVNRRRNAFFVAYNGQRHFANNTCWLLVTSVPVEFVASQVRNFSCSWDILSSSAVDSKRKGFFSQAGDCSQTSTANDPAGVHRLSLVAQQPDAFIL